MFWCLKNPQRNWKVPKSRCNAQWTRVSIHAIANQWNWRHWSAHEIQGKKQSMWKCKENDV